MALDIVQVGELDRPAFVARFGGVFEDSPWVAEQAYAFGPFADTADLYRAMAALVATAPRERQLALIRAHPDLAGKAAIAGELTPESTAEQAAAGLDRLSPDQFARISALNAAYRERFDLPFIICAREHDADGIIAAMERRLDNTPEDEIGISLEEIGRIARLRLDDLIA